MDPATFKMLMAAVPARATVVTTRLADCPVCATDHVLLFGRVVKAHVIDAPPLVCTARAFGTHSKLINDRQPTTGDAIIACAS